MNFNKLSSAFATALLALVPVGAFANHVDFFEDGAFSLSTSSGSTTATQTGLPTGTVLGGQRVDTLTKVTGGNGNSVSAVLQQGTTGGITDNNDVSVLFSGGGNARGTLLFQYGQGGDLNANFLDIPGSVNDWDRVRVTFGATSSPIDVRVDLFSRENGGSASSLTQSFAGGSGNVDFLYASFNSGAGLSDAFLRNVDQASLFLGTNSSTSNNFSVNLLSFNRNGLVGPAATVPEPGTLLLLGVALAGMVVTTRRRKG